MKNILSFICLAFLSGQYEVECNISILPEAFYYNLTTTSSTDFFLAQNQRQYTGTIKEFELRLDEFKNLYMTRLEVLNYNQELFETNLNEIEYKLNPLELLDDMSDYCVQKYRSKLPILATIKTNFANCNQKVNSAYPGIAGVAEATVRNLKNYYATTLANSIKDCKKKFEHIEANYTACISTAVKTTNTVTSTNTNTFNNQLKTAACTADLKIREGFDCYGNILKTGLGAISETEALIENCIAGRELCPTCDDDNLTYKGRCPYQMSWHIAENDLHSEKITNPFKGISLETPCLQINFINKSVQLV